MSRVFALGVTVVGALGQAGDDVGPPRPRLDPARAGPAKHIWSPVMRDQQRVFFRRRIVLPEGVRAPRIVAACDNRCEVHVDGQRKGASGAWEQLLVIDLPDVAAGEHVVAVRGENSGGPAALVVWVLWEDAAGAPHALVSDREWRCSTGELDGWEGTKFDDSGWEAAVENGDVPFARTVYGMEPSGLVVFDRFSELTEAIDQALASMRARPDDAAAMLQSLAEIERAVVRARQLIWDGRRQGGEVREDGAVGGQSPDTPRARRHR